jgi:hypothetical protein
MITKIFHSQEAKIGEVFTPVVWAKWVINKWNVFDRWIGGATLCDPTAGQGAFALALLQEAAERHVPITQELLSRIHLIEIKQSNLDVFSEKAKTLFNIKLPKENIHCLDVITNTPNLQCDILIGNPPWANFTDLPADYKETLKPCFQRADLIADKRAVLLGASRIDIAALVIEIALGQLLANNGNAYFFLPISLFTGDDAHAGFRDYTAFGTPFSVTEVHEFNKTKIFENVGTSYCCAAFERKRPQTFPVPYFRENNTTEWDSYEAVPLNGNSDSWRVIPAGEETKINIHIPIAPNQKPRQGVNTCGANDVFIFDEYPDFIEDEFLFPLASKETWKNNEMKPQKWIFLPYDRTTGRPLEAGRFSNTKGYAYLASQKETLLARKGTLINSMISKGCWWALLGVGYYSFAPYKVIWPAYGKNDFTPRILSDVNGQMWQGNQSLHAFIPCWEKDEAERVLDLLDNSQVSLLLCQLNGEGKCNWAQPGKMKKILAFNERKTEQLCLL